MKASSVGGSGSNITFDRTAGSHSLAAAGQRDRYAHRVRLSASGADRRGPAGRSGRVPGSSKSSCGR